MLLTIYGKNVEFSDKEKELFDEIGLELDNDFLEVILDSNTDKAIIDNATYEELHDICIESIKEYTKLICNTLNYIEKENADGGNK